MTALAPSLASPIERGKPELEIIGTAKRTDRTGGEGRGEREDDLQGSVDPKISRTISSISTAL